jgi:hypothetical protein
MRGLLAVAVGRRGGESRARRLSPQRRKELAAWARWNREQRERGERTDAEFIKLVIHKLRAVDPDLAITYRKITQMSWRFQGQMLDGLSLQDKEKVRIAWESVCPK